MGDVADMMLDGTLCATCGVTFGDVEDEDWMPPGYPRWCSTCVKSMDGLFEKDGQRLASGCDLVEVDDDAVLAWKYRQEHRGNRGQGPGCRGRSLLEDHSSLA